MVTVNRFDNGKSNDRLHGKKFGVQSVPYGKINTILNASEPVNHLKVMYIRLQSYTIFVIFRTFSTEIQLEPCLFKLYNLCMYITFNSFRGSRCQID